MLAAYAVVIHANARPMEMAIGISVLAVCYLFLCAWILSRWFLPASRRVAGMHLMPTRTMPLPYSDGWRLLWAILWRSTLLSVAAQAILALLARTGAFSPVSIGVAAMVAMFAAQICAFIWLATRQDGSIQFEPTPA
jgi:hypothetical protein